MQTEAVSLSPCRKTPPAAGILRDMYSGISFWGVMGYPAKNRHPARIAASATASFPFRNCLSMIPSFPAGSADGSRDFVIFSAI
jgi:hypothetical protein